MVFHAQNLSEQQFASLVSGRTAKKAAMPCQSKDENSWLHFCRCLSCNELFSCAMHFHQMCVAFTKHSIAQTATRHNSYITNTKQCANNIVVPHQLWALGETWGLLCGHPDMDMALTPIRNSVSLRDKHCGNFLSLQFICIDGFPPFEKSALLSHWFLFCT